MQLYLDYERISHHQSMLSDKVRTETFRKSILESVSPGDIVADVGTGTGVLALFASQAGAKHVYAIERTDIINVAMAISKANGVHNITFIKGDAAKIKLNEKCDVVISECIGYFVLQENMLSDIIAFRDNNLKPNGVIIPSKINLFISLVSSSKPYENVSFWSKKLYGLDFSHLRKIAANSTYHLGFDEKDLITNGVLVKKIDLNRDEKISFNVNIQLKVKKSAVSHGLCGYFSTILPPDFELSNSPQAKATHWNCEFFPFKEPLKMKKSQVVYVKIKAELHKAFVDWYWGIEAEGKTFWHSTKKGIRLKESLGLRKKG